MRRRTLLLAACASAGPLHTQAAAPGGVTRRSLVFPADFGAHPGTHVEWWYVTGAIETAGGQAPAKAETFGSGSAETFGFQITFFRSRTEVRADHPSRFAAQQLIFAHAALTDLRQGRLRHDQRIARAGFGIAHADEGDTNVALRDWHLQRHGTPAGSRYQAQVRSDSAGYALELTLAATQPVLLQGDAGYSRKGPREEQASHYYSEPQLRAAGRLTLDGRVHEVRGQAWLDHEWSDALMDAQAVGWDWIGMNLLDGSALTAFRLRGRDGSALWAGGSFRRPREAAHDFAADAVRFTPERHWTSPASAARYPVEWRIDTPAGRFAVRALLDNQELDSRASTGAIYWEGLSELNDAEGRVVGRGYLEMTGYAARLVL